MTDDPPAPRDDTTGEVAQLRAALRDALRLLDSVDADANNVQLDIQKFKRRHHRVIEPPWIIHPCAVCGHHACICPKPDATEDR